MKIIAVMHTSQVVVKLKPEKNVAKPEPDLNPAMTA